MHMEKFYLLASAGVGLVHYLALESPYLTIEITHYSSLFRWKKLIILITFEGLSRWTPWLPCVFFFFFFGSGLVGCTEDNNAYVKNSNYCTN